MTNLFKCQVAGKQNRKTQFSKDFYFIGHHLFLFLRPFIALCRNWNLFHSLWMLFHKLLCWRLLMQCWTGRKAEDLWAAAFLQPFRAGERERIRIGESPQIWKDKWNLGEMFLGRCGGQMYGSSRKFKPKKGLLGKEGSQEREVHAGCRLWGALSHLCSPSPGSNGDGDGVGFKEGELWISGVLSQALKSASFHSSTPEQGLLMCAVCSVQLGVAERIAEPFFPFSLLRCGF